MAQSHTGENEGHHRSLIKTWYDGGAFHGSQIQPGVETVDGTLIAGLRELGYFPPGDGQDDRFETAGRTDKGVSALGAVQYIDTVRPFHPCELNRWLGSRGKPVLTWAVAKLNARMTPRRAVNRTYKYFHVPASGRIDISNLHDALPALLGTRDFKAFTKAGTNPNKTTVRRMDAASLEVTGGIHVFTFTASGFLWEQVRRMVAFLLQSHDDPLLAKKLADVLESGKQLKVHPVDPRGLVLWEIDHGPGIKWENEEGCLDQAFLALRKRDASMQIRASMSAAITREVASHAREPRVEKK